MNTAYTPSAPSGGIAGWLRRAEAWLDDRGRPAWIVAIVAGFIVFWPIGLGLLGYAIWSKRMFGQSCRKAGRSHAWDRRHDGYTEMARAFRPSGNAAFDAYKAETIRRLTDEQEAFEAFLQRLREAKDKTEFDNFMEDRARAAQTPAEQRTTTGEDPRAAGY